MSTANATTNGAGYIVMGAATVYERSINNNDLYADKAQNTMRWKQKEQETLAVLTYRDNRMVGIGALQLLNNHPKYAIATCNVYQSVHTRHIAIHCPAAKLVVVVHPRRGYVIREDTQFIENIR
jgi:hypothetical protein